MLRGLGACPRIQRGRAHGACTASARREEEAMSMHIVDDEQRSDRRATPMRPLGSGLEGASASLALLDDVHRHRLRRAALHLPLPSQERGPFQFSDSPLAGLQDMRFRVITEWLPSLSWAGSTIMKIDSGRRVLRLFRKKVCLLSRQFPSLCVLGNWKLGLLHFSKCVRIR